MKLIAKKLWHLIPRNLRYAVAKVIREILFEIRLFFINNFRKKNYLNENQKPINISIFGFFNSNLGHSTAAILLAKELEIQGHKVSRIDVSKMLNSIVEDNKAATHFSNKDSSDTIIFVINPDLLVNVIWKYGLKNFTGKKIIGYWAWELDILPKKWIKCQNLVDEIWVPSKYNADTFDLNFNIPIKVVPHAVALNPPKPLDKNLRDEYRKKLGIDENTFLVFQSFSFASSMERKNIFGAIEAFNLAFADNENARLLIRYHGADIFINAYERLVRKVGNSKNIILLKAKDYEQLFSCYCATDCYISLHRSEGFGLNLAEMLLMGIPVIATNYSGNLEFMNNENSYLVDYELIPVKDPDNIYNLDGAKWADPEIKEVVDLLITIFAYLKR